MGALATYRGHFGALVAAGALAIAPASLLEGGALRVGVARLSTGAAARPEAAPPRTPFSAFLHDRASSSAEPAQLLEAVRSVAPLAYQVFLGALLLFAGAWLALAVIAALVAEPGLLVAQAWALALSRIGPLFGTALLTALCIASGALFFVLPGIAVAVGLAFAVPVVQRERLSGMPALHRSWLLVRPVWPQVLGWLVLLASISAGATLLSMLAPPGALRPLIAMAVRVLLWPLPLAGIALAYDSARA